MNVSYDLKGYLFYRDNSDIPVLYESHGVNIGKYLQGEFLLTIVDEDKIVTVSDFGGTRSSDIMPRNTTIVTDINTGKILNYFPNLNTTKTYYIPPQGVIGKEQYDDFFEALDVSILNSIQKTKELYVFLSGGHDSGSITSALINSGADFKVLSVVGNEPIEVLKQRWDFLETNGIEVIKVGADGPLGQDSYQEYKTQYEDDGLGTNYREVCSHYLACKHLPENVTLLSGLGADELYVSGDDELLNQFMRSTKKVYDHFNVDIRYPLLDYNLYVEFFSLVRNLRRRWKQPFEKYMEQIRFPYNKEGKIGFYVFDDY